MTVVERLLSKLISSATKLNEVLSPAGLAVGSRNKNADMRRRILPKGEAGFGVLFIHKLVPQDLRVKKYKI